MLRLFIRAAHAFKVGKKQNITAREAGCDGSVRTGYDYIGRETVTPKYLKSGFFGNREFYGVFCRVSYIYISVIRHFKNLFIYILYKPTPVFPVLPIFPELNFVNKEKAERGIDFNVQCAVCNVQWLPAKLYKEHRLIV